jgi:signal transduction histidine kinase
MGDRQSAGQANEDNMPARVLDVGFSVLRQQGSGSRASKPARRLVNSALKSRSSTNLQVRCALLLATADWCTPRTFLAREVRSALHHSLHYDVPLIGGSMAKLFCSLVPGGFIDPGVILLLLCSNDLWVTVDHLDQPYNSKSGPDRRQLKKLAAKLENAAKVRLGSSAERYLCGIMPGFLPDGDGGRMLRDGELYYEILASFQHRYQLLGASATDQIKGKIGYQFANDRCIQSGLALALVESDIGSGTAMEHGFKPHGKMRVSADELVGAATVGYETAKLDGLPAVHRILQLRNELKLREDENPVFGLRSGDDFKIILPIDPLATGDGPVRVNRRIAARDCFYVMSPKQDQMLDVVTRTLDEAVNASRKDGSDLSLILGFVCTGLFAYDSRRGADWSELGRLLQEKYPAIPVVLGLCAGEFGVDLRHGARFNNMSLSARCSLNCYSSRARTRDLQQILLKAAAVLLTCDSPGKVMETALGEAVTAGAQGGQICLVDHQLGLILGEGFGYATPVSPLGHDWPAVARITIRRAPDTTDGVFPPELEEWAMPVVRDIPAKHPTTRKKDEDILTLVTRTLRAVFVPDATKKKFRCDKRATKISRFKAHLAIPLVGSSHRVIGTFQLSFPDGTLLDRESFSLWVGYAQNIASTLEREQEIEERKTRGKLLEIGNAILREPISLERDRFEWCNRYLEEVGRSLGADYTHMRVLMNDNQFYLVGAAPTGLLSELRRLTRPVTRAGTDGACSRKSLEAGGIVTNSGPKTRSFHRSVRAIENAARYGDQLRNEVATIHSTAVLPLSHQSTLVGTWVIDSSRDNFFTERRLRIIRAAGKFLGTMVRVKDADHTHAVMSDYRKRLQWASKQEPSTAWLDRILQLLCEIMRADWGSLFVWDETSRKLILQASFNWHMRQEGLACFDLNEGWIGRLAGREEDIGILPPSSRHARFRDKHRDSIEPPEQRIAQNPQTPRIGLKLTARDALVGVVTLGYYEAHSDRLPIMDDLTRMVLTNARHEIALTVTAVKEKAERDRQEQLHLTKQKVATLLIAASKPEADWQPVVDELHKGFPGDRVTLYLVENDSIVYGCSSPVTSLPQPIKLKDYTVMRELIKSLPDDPGAVLMSNLEDHRLNQRPDGEAVRTLFASAVWSLERRPCGVLFVDRSCSRSYPFAFVPDVEKRAVWDITQMLGVAISARDTQRAYQELQNRFTTATQIAATSLYSAAVMHELMNPFVRIQRAVDLLRRSPGEDPQPHYATIEAQKDRAVAIIEQARRQGVPGAHVEDLRAIVRNAVQVIKPSIRPAISLNDLNKEQMKVRVDSMSIVSALVNLLNNALEAIEGKGVLTVVTERSPDGRNAVVRIHNSGPRLTAKQIERMSRPGYSVKGEHHSGLGLPLAKQAVEAAGGTLRLDSPEQGGVEAVVSLPVCEDAPSEGPSVRGGNL